MIKNEINFEKLKKKHLKEVINLVSQLSDYKPAEDTLLDIWRNLYKQKNSLSIVAMEKKKIIGYGFICVNQTVRGGKIAYIEDIICDNSYRKKGIGKSIMKQLFSFAKDNKCYKIVLQCNKNNISFYKKCGYELHNYNMQITIPENFL